MGGFGEKKGTVTALGSLVSSEDTQKASDRVRSAIADRHSDLRRLHSFVADNAALSQLVRQLPNDLSHEIMVPFGGAAFFPGRIIHTNEFLMLLGDGYYAERSAKQAVEILRRRGKALEDQVEKLKASVRDLEAEAAFFDSTANEVQEGIVEIREEYVEESQSNESRSGVPDSNALGSSKAKNSKVDNKEEEYARIMALLDELEKQEREAENVSVSDEDEDTEVSFVDDDSEVNDEDEDSQDDHINGDESEPSLKLKSKVQVQNSRAQEMSAGGGSLNLAHQSSISVLNSQFATEGGSGRSTMERPLTAHKPPLPFDPSMNVSNFSGMKLEDSSDNTTRQTVQSGFGNRKAFMGPVIEHSHGLQSNEPTKSTTSNQPSKPVSRFKMQKGHR